MMRDVIDRDGVRYVLVPEPEYLRLCDAHEDLEDIRLYDEAKAMAGETVPANVVARLVAGETPLRVYRDYRGLTQQQLADMVGVSRAFICQMESGARAPSLDTVKRLAGALQLDVDDLV